MSYCDCPCAREVARLRDELRTLEHQLTSLKYDLERRSTIAAPRCACSPMTSPMFPCRSPTRDVPDIRVRTCIDCTEEFALPKRGYWAMVRCQPCRQQWRKARQTKTLRSLKGRFSSGRGSAKSRGTRWELTYEQYTRLMSQGTCDYCGNELNATGSGLDRQDDARPYTVDNVVPCCWPCNHLRKRGAFTPSEMRRLGPVLGPIWKVHPPSGGTFGRSNTASA